MEEEQTKRKQGWVFVTSKKLSSSSASYILPSPVSLHSPSLVHRVIALSEPSFPFSLKSRGFDSKPYNFETI